MLRAIVAFVVTFGLMAAILGAICVALTWSLYSIRLLVLPELLGWLAGIVGIVVMMSLLASGWVAAGSALFKGLPLSRYLWSAVALVLSFCALYIALELWFGAPQRALMDAARDAISRDGFSISRGLVDQLGLLSLLLFPIFLITGLIDLLCLPFVPWFDAAVHRQAALLLGYGIGLGITSAIPWAAVALWQQRRHEAARQTEAETARALE